MAAPPPSGKKRITLQSLDADGARVTAICGDTLEETREMVGRKLSFANPAACRLFNKYGAEIDHIDLVLHDDLLYASSGCDFPLSRSASRPGLTAMSQGGSVLTAIGASTLDGHEGDDSAAAHVKGDYLEMGRVLGNGGQGTTYLTVDKRTGEQSVLKQIFCAGLPETNRAIEEAMMLSRLKHPRVVSYSEVFLGNDPNKGNYVGIIMEFCAGGDLYQMLCKQRNKRKPISVRRIRMWILQMAEALKYLHEQKVIHRDMKPMNVLLDAAGDLKIADFGLARHGVTASKLAMTQCGTPGYESPEVQMGNGYDFKTDVWGLGCVVCDMTTQRFMHERPGSFATQVQCDPKAIVKVIQPIMDLYGADIHGLVASMLVADPAKRPSAAEIAECKFLHHRGKHDLSAASEATTVTPERGSHMLSSVGGSWRSRRSAAQRSPAAASSVPRRSSMDRDRGSLSNAEDGVSGSWHGEKGVWPASPLDDEISRRSEELTLSESVDHFEVLVVSKRPGRDQYGSISQALRVATEGMTIEILEGKYQEELVIDKPVTIQAAGSALTGGFQPVEIQGVSLRPVVVSRSSGAMIRGISLLHLSQVSQEGKDCTRCLDIVGGSLVLEECRVSSVCGVGVVARDGAKVSAYRCAVNRCGQNGFFLYDKGGALIEDCDVLENAFPGIGMDNAVDTIIRRTQVRHGKGDGVKIYGGARILVENCVVSHNGQVGISLEDGADPVVRDNTIHDGNSCGISVLSGARGLIENNDIHDNAHPNVYIADGADPTLRSNAIHHSASCGVTCVEEGVGIIEDNDIFENQSVGLYIMNRANPVVRNNTVRDSGGDGIAVCFEGRGLLDSNIIKNNAGVGVLVESDAEPRVTRNKVLDSQLDGIKVCKSGKGHIEGNTVVNAGTGGAGGAGIMVSFGAAPVVKNNTIKDCTSFGICVSDEAAGTIERNNITTTKSHGIAVFRRANPVVRGNIVRDNSGVGILVAQAGGGTFSENRLGLNRGHHALQMIVEPGCSAVVRDNISG